MIISILGLSSTFEYKLQKSIFRYSLHIERKSRHKQGIHVDGRGSNVSAHYLRTQRNATASIRNYHDGAHPAPCPAATSPRRRPPGPLRLPVPSCPPRPCRRRTPPKTAAAGRCRGGRRPPLPRGRCGLLRPLLPGRPRFRGAARKSR